MNTPVVSAPPSLGSAGASADKRVLFISHEASRTGAPMLLLHFLRWLRRNTDLAFDILIPKSGPLEAEFAKVTTVYAAKAFADAPRLIRRYGLIYSNTLYNGAVVDELGAEGIPVITHVHELESGYHCVGAIHMALVLRQTTRFVTCAQLVGQRLRETFGIEESRVGVRYGMIDPTEMDARVAQSNLGALRETYGIPENAFLVVGCGTLDLRKGTDLFLQAAVAMLKRVDGSRPLRFLWIGSHKALDLMRALTDDVRKLGLKKEIQFIGELPSPHGLISLADVYWLTSREDPYPLTMLESAALGRPVLCFDGSGGGREFCAFGGGASVPYMDVVALAEKTIELMQEPERREALGAQAAALVRQRFVVESIAPMMWADLHEWLHGPSPLNPAPTERASLGEIYAQWPLETAPDRAFVVAHRERRSAIENARALVASGRKREGIKALLAAASAGIAIKDPQIILESLVDIGTELAALEPRQSTYLLGEADRISQASPALKTMVQVFRRGARRAAQLR